MKNFDLWMSISGSLLIAAPIQAQKKAKEKQPNVIFIIADDLGYGDMSCYGAHRVQTPHVDALASSGIRFTDAHAVASTSTPHVILYSPDIMPGVEMIRELPVVMQVWLSGRSKLRLQICLSLPDIRPELSGSGI